MPVRMKIKMPSRYVLLGISLALMLQTNYRIADLIGVGEILAMVYFALVLVIQGQFNRLLKVRRLNNFTGFYVACVALIITPVTLLSFSSDTPGLSFRDLISYYFICGILLTLPSEKEDIHVIIVTFLVVLFATICFHYLWGDSSAYYYARFTGGAKNPNQLATYLVVAVLLAAFLQNIIYRIVIVLLSAFFGIASASDAYLVFLLVSTASFITLTILPHRHMFYALPLIIFLIYISTIYFELLDILFQQWSIADQGDSRTQLYISALNAWISTPFSFIFGNGAGSFSGLENPFERAEAHNTALDLATIGGIFGLILFPTIPLWILFRSLVKNYKFASSIFIGMMLFSLFHFVGRQPIFWVSIVLYAQLTQLKWNLKPSGKALKSSINRANK